MAELMPEIRACSRSRRNGDRAWRPSRTIMSGGNRVETGRPLYLWRTRGGARGRVSALGELVEHRPHLRRWHVAPQLDPARGQDHGGAGQAHALAQGVV